MPRSFESKEKRRALRLIAGSKHGIPADLLTAHGVSRALQFELWKDQLVNAKSIEFSIPPLIVLFYTISEQGQTYLDQTPEGDEA